MSEAKPLVLVVEDEALLAYFVEQTLTDAGYEVLLAANGEEALAAIAEQVEDLAGLVTDIRWRKGPDGWEIARAARDLNHSLPVIYMTGDSAADWAVQGVPKSVMLQKPFTPVQLTTALANLQNEQDSSLD